MLKQGTEELLQKYSSSEAAIAASETPLRESVIYLTEAFRTGGQLLICGNGGSCADADHIVGELVKAFRIERPLEPTFLKNLQSQGEHGDLLAQRLQGGLPAINLGAHSALMTAMINDVGGEYIYAQQVAAYGKAGDILVGISTSGNSVDILLAGRVAKAKGMRTLGLTGRNGGQMKDLFDTVICAPADSTEEVQDLHSKIYHALCACVEYELWG